MLRRHILLPALVFCRLADRLGDEIMEARDKKACYYRLVHADQTEPCSIGCKQEAFNCIYFTYLFLTQSYTVLSKNRE